jgi:outer membrane lipoprotein-sorting protein
VMRRILPILVVLLACSFCHADDVKQVIADMKKAYSEAKSAKVKLEMTLPFLQEISPGSEDYGLRVEMNYIAPAKVHVSMKSEEDDGEDMILENGKVIWSKSGDHEEDEGSSDEEEDVDPEDYSDDGGPHLMFGDFFFQAETLFSTDAKGAFGGSDLDAHSERWNDKQWTVIQETFSKQGIIRRFYVDPETFLIWRVTDSDIDEDKIMADFTVTSMDLNVEIDPELVKPPR